jgi:hypothetical protein
MKKSDINKNDNAEFLKKKLEAIIEHSRAENEALKKILKGLEKMNNKQKGNDRKS